jgi:tryptophanyl-tRNA synthetase
MARKTVLTGIRTTGKLHLGHYVGALKQWKEIQDSGEYECFFLLADVQALTTHADNPSLLTQSVHDVVMDWLSIGLNPDLPHVHFVLQSQVPQRHELSILLGMVAKYSELMRNPTLKEELGKQVNATAGFMYYPVDQAADIYMVSPCPPQEGDELLVPVGKDQESHLEFAREIARDFNRDYGQTIVPCQGLIGEIGRLVGTNGSSKMSKSEGNAIFLADDPLTLANAVRHMYTDPNRTNPSIPGDPDNTPALIYLRAFNPNREEVEDFENRYRTGNIGDAEIKQRLIVVLNEFLDPIRQNRLKYNNTDIGSILEEGSLAAQSRCQIVVNQVRDHMHLKIPRSG